MNFIDRTLNDSLEGLDFLRDYLRLLESALSKIDPKTTVDLSDCGRLITCVSVGPNPAACKKEGGRNPLLDSCDRIFSKPKDPMKVEIKELILLTANAGRWCDAIHGALGDPIGPRVDPDPRARR